jgi:hypothetical protein
MKYVDKKTKETNLKSKMAWTELRQYYYNIVVAQNRKYEIEKCIVSDEQNLVLSDF